MILGSHGLMKLVVLDSKIRSEHILLNGFPYLIKKYNSKNCERCDKVINIHHLAQARKEAFLKTN